MNVEENVRFRKNKMQKEKSQMISFILLIHVLFINIY